MTTPTTVNVRLQLRADTAANWTAANPTLLANEVGLETDTKKLKVGNGSSAWNSLAYFPSIVSGGTVLGNLEIGSTGTLTFEGSTADGFETTLAVTNPTADRTITLPNQSGTVVVSGNASIVDADIAANAEIAVSKLADGAARQLLQTDAAGTGVEWTSNVDIPGTLDVTSTATFDSDVTVTGNLTVNGTTTNINTQNLVVEDKNIILGDVATPSDTTADGGGITLKGATDKTINWVDATDAWTSSERFSIPLGSAASPSLTFTGDENTGIYSPGADQVAISTGGSGRLFINSSGNVSIGTTNAGYGLRVTGGIFADASSITIADNFGLGWGNTLLAGSNNGALVATTSGSERLRITSAGLVGVGTSSPGSILHCNSGSAADVYVRTSNSAASSGFDVGVSSGGIAYVFNRNNTDLRFGTNGAERVTVTAGGNVGIGTTSPSSLLTVAGKATLTGAEDNQLEWSNGSQIWRANSVSGGNWYLYDATNAKFPLLVKPNSSSSIDIASTYLAFGTGGTERFRCDSSGRLLVGTSSALNVGAYSSGFEGFQVAGTTSAARASLSRWDASTADPGITLAKSRGGTVGTNGIVSSGDNIGRVEFTADDGTSFLTAARILAQVDGTPGTNDMPGRLVFSTTADGASSPTERMRIDSGGALRHTGSGSISTSTGYSSVGCAMEPDGTLLVTRASNPSGFFNRLTNDGTLITFAQDTVTEGSISVSGTTVSYNGAHLSRWSQLPAGAERTEILRGTVLSNIDEMCEWGEEDNEQLNRMKISDVEGDKNVSGVFQAWDDDDDTYTNDFYCAMTGDFIIRIGAGITVERGDLLMSAGDGTAKPQDDDIIRSKTIAKVTSTNVSCTYEDGSYCVPCVLMAC